jgi:tetratricopeptide (TPR) repeat protein
MSTLWWEEWESLFSQGSQYSGRAEDLLLSKGINSFDQLVRAVNDSRFSTKLDRSGVNGWLDVVRTLGQVTHLDSSSNALCHDLAGSICHKFSEQVSIGGKGRARFLYEWAEINSRRRKVVESLTHISEARKLDTGNLDYAIWHANLLEYNYPFEAHDDIVAIYGYCLSRSTTLAEKGEITPQAAAYYQARAHIGLGDAGAGNRAAHYRDALELVQSRGDRDLDLQSQALIGLGNLSVAKREWALARQYFRQALDLARPIGRADLEARAYIGLGDAHDHRKKNYGMALGLAEAIKDPKLQAEALTRLGDVAEASGEFALADQYFWLALQQVQVIEDQNLQAQALIRLGDVAVARREWDFAREYFGQALDLNLGFDLRKRVQKTLRIVESAEADSRKKELREALYKGLKDLTLELIALLQEVRTLRGSHPDAARQPDEDRRAVVLRLLERKDELAVKISATFNELKQRAGVSDQGKTATGLQRTLNTEETDKDLCRKCGVENRGLQLVNQLVRNPFKKIEEELKREVAPRHSLRNGA